MSCGTEAYKCCQLKLLKKWAEYIREWIQQNKIYMKIQNNKENDKLSKYSNIVNTSIFAKTELDEIWEKQSHFNIPYLNFSKNILHFP